MKKLLLIILLLSALPINANSEDWIRLDKGGEGDFYIDLDSVRKTDGYSYVWTMVDFREPITNRGGNYFSAKVYDQIDCSIGRSKRLAYNFYRESMGRGDVATENGNGEWKYYPPGSKYGEVLKIVCNYD